MTCIIIGDVIGSRKLHSKYWVADLKQLLNTFGKSPGNWEIYRGDEFQLEVQNPAEALITAIKIKAYLKTREINIRMSIGIGDKTHKSRKISESNGTAFIRSGEVFETLKKYKVNLAINTGNPEFDSEMNLMLRFSMIIMDNWLAQSAEFVITAIEDKSYSQEEIGRKLGINQAAVSRRQKRAQFDLLMEFDNFYRKKIQILL